MKTNSPTHEEVAQRAHTIWKTRGSPSGCDTAIWFEAEQQLTASPSKPTPASPAHPDAHPPTHPVPAPSPGEAAAKALQQKNAARAPHLPGKNAPKPAPPESGKPIWDKPHSS